jgi:hypothetical protein
MGDHLLSNITKLKEEEKKTAITPNTGNQVFFWGIPQ